MKSFLLFLIIVITINVPANAGEWKNKNDDKYLLKYIGYSKVGAAKEGLTKCMEKFTNFSDQENNACYVHYESKVGKF